MLDQNDILKIKNEALKFFQKATIPILKIEASLSTSEEFSEDNQAANLDIEITDPQILIGEKGQTLFEIQKLLRIVLNKNLQKRFYLNLDINNYKKKKADYLKEMAKSLANEVFISKQEKSFPPMSAYERRIIHTELSQRQDVITKSLGDGFDRHIIVKPR